MSRMKEMVLNDIELKCAQLAEKYGYTKKFIEDIYYSQVDYYAGSAGWDEILKGMEETFESLPGAMHSFLQRIQLQVDWCKLPPITVPDGIWQEILTSSIT